MSKALVLLIATIFSFTITSCRTTENFTWQVQSDLSEQDVAILHSLIKKHANKSPATVTNDSLLAEDLGITKNGRSEIVFALERYKGQELYDYDLEPKTVGNLLDIIKTLQVLKEIDDG